MPMYESACAVINCPENGRVFEWYSPRFDDKNPPCRYCAQPTTRQVSRFNSPFSGEIGARYLDKSREGGHGDTGAHWAWKKNTISGKPEPVYIETFQQQREYCKSEGLALPSDTQPGFISSDGKTINRATDSEVKEFIAHTNVESAKIAAEKT